MEIVDVWIFLFPLSLSKTHIKSTHPYITDSSLQSDFKLPCILVKHCQDPFLLFLLISCVYGVSGRPPMPLFPFSSPQHTSSHLCFNALQRAETDKRLHLDSHGAPYNATPTYQDRTAWQAPATHCLLSERFAANQTHLLPTVTCFS